MKLVFNSLLILFTSGVSLAQTADFNSRDEFKGDWTTGQTWTNNVAPTTTLSGNNNDVTINGFVSLTGNLSVSSVLTINSGDTLYINGDLEVGGNGDLVVNGVLFVSGNYSGAGNASISNTGIIAVDGDFTMNKTNNISNSGGNIYATGASNYNETKSGSDLSSEQPNLVSTFVSPQPIELLYFSGTSEHGKVHLDWTTAWEENFDFFTIERAGTDRVFKAIGEVKGKGNSTAEVAYSFTDNSPLEGQVFYRLKATDFDGTLEYHRIISVYTESLASASLQVYPNPLRDQQLSISTQGFTPEELKIMDLSGKVLFSERVTENTRQFSLPSQIRAGAYLLIITNPQGDKLQQKIMVL